MSKASEPQPSPAEGTRIVLHEVLKDIRDRAEAGLKKYGTYLKTNNGRDALMDAYQESLDLAMYLKQALMERDASNDVLESDIVDYAGECPKCHRNSYYIDHDGIRKHICEPEPGTKFCPYCHSDNVRVDIPDFYNDGKALFLSCRDCDNMFKAT